MAADDVMGKIAFQAPDEGTGTDAVLVAAAIQARSEGDFSSSANATSLDFMTGASEAATTKMSVMSSGNVGINTAAPLAKLHVKVATNENLRIQAGSTVSDSGSVVMHTVNDADDSSVPMYLRASRFSMLYGNVGIGTLAPESDSILELEKGSPGPRLRLTNTTAGGKSYKIHSNNSGNLTVLGNGNDTRILLDDSGNVGIGCTPAKKLNVSSSAEIARFDGTAGANDHVISIKNNSETNNTSTNIFFADSYDGSSYASSYIRGTASGTSVLIFATGGTNFTNIYDSGAPSERMRITAAGVVSIGGTAATAKLNVIGQGGSNVQLQNNIVTGTGGMVQIGFLNDNGLVGSIQTSGTATSYVTSSDYRLKENIEYTWNATSRLKKLKPVRFNFITDAEKTFDGFLAHEAQAVVPEAVTGTKDEVDDDDKPVMQGIDQAKLVPLLVKTVQEQQTVIESLEARITALE